MSAKTITLDTNCIYTRQDNEAVNMLERAHERGLVEIVKTDVMDTELKSARPSFKRKAFRKSQKYREDMGVGVFDHSRFDHCVFGGDSIDYPLEEIKNLLFPRFDKLNERDKKKAIRDSMHLATHKMYNRDFFVTEDKHFLEKKQILKERFGVIVINPENVVKVLKLIAGLCVFEFDNFTR